MSTTLFSLIFASVGTIPDPTVDMLVVFGIILVALVFFVTEIVPIDITAIGVMVTVILLEPWTHISPRDGIMGFANPATITVLAMFILSEGIRRTGLLRVIGNKIIEISGANPMKRMGAVIGLSGGTAGFINNTPVVAMMIPMAVNIAKKTRTSPSTLLMPISFAAMLGGMLTVIGTSTNILAADLSERLIDRSISMFEFFHLGLLVLVVGCAYLLFIGRHFIPERIKPRKDLTEEFELRRYLTEVVVKADSPLIGDTVGQALEATDADIDVIKMTRNGEAFSTPLINKQFHAGDVLLMRTNRDTLVSLMDEQGLEPVSKTRITQEDFDVEDTGETLIELVLLSENPLVGETLRSSTFAQRYNAIVLAVRRGGEFIYDHIDRVPLRAGDALLVQASQMSIKRFANNRNFVVIQEETDTVFRRSKTPIALAILAGVVGLAAFEVLPILVAALVGVVAMIGTGCVRPNEVYDSVDWSVIFLLAGVIPLGVALERSGGAEFLAQAMVAYSAALPAIVTLFIFYIFTTLITQVISNNASVILMIPVAVQAANLVGAEPFSFILAVMFASSTAMLTPVGYQTNLMVYGPGGYRFTDFFWVGAPLQLIVAIVTCGGIALFWGI